MKEPESYIIIVVTFLVGTPKAPERRQELVGKFYTVEDANRERAVYGLKVTQGDCPRHAYSHQYAYLRVYQESGMIETIDLERNDGVNHPYLIKLKKKDHQKEASVLRDRRDASWNVERDGKTMSVYVRDMKHGDKIVIPRPENRTEVGIVDSVERGVLYWDKEES